MAQKPKPVLVDRSRTPTKGQNISPTERSVHVTFASAGNQSVVSSMASVIPTLKTAKPGTAAQGNSKSNGKHNPNNTKPTTGENSTKEAKTTSANYRTGNKTAKSQSPGPSGQSNRVGHQKSTKSPKSTAMAGESPVEKLPREKSKESVNSVGSSASKHSKGSSTNQERSTKSKKNLRKSTKLSSKSSKGIFKRSKSGKKLKTKASTSSTSKNQENEVMGTAQPQLNAEYVSELSKIAQILREVSAFDATTSTVNASINIGTSPRVKITSLSEGTGSASNGSIQRPLSTGELKQLLSSITRLVSLHQLENVQGNPDAGTSSALENPSSVSLKRAKIGSTSTTKTTAKSI